MSNPLIAIKLGIENLRSLAFGSISAGFTAVGTALANPANALKFTNTTDKEVIISDDGINDKIVLVAGEIFVFDVASDKSNRAETLAMGKGTILYVKQGADGAPTSGNVYISVFYAKG